MRRTEIEKAFVDAHRFIETATVLLREMKERSVDSTDTCRTRAAGDCRRASMDLSRQLSKMRKP